MNPLIKALKKVFGEDSVAVAPFVEDPLVTAAKQAAQATWSQPPQLPLHIQKAMQKAQGRSHPYKESAEPRDDNPPFECAICHTVIPNRNDVVCFADVGGDGSKIPPYLAIGVPKKGWSKLVCSSKCAHAMLDQHIVTWRLRGLFNIPEELDEY